MLWLLMNIGCIECGCTSAVVGIFIDKPRAEELAAKMNADKRTNWLGGGQNLYKVFELPSVYGEVAEDYREVAES